MPDSKITSKWLGAVVVLQAVILLTLWGGQSLPVARAEGIPDAGAQQQEIINQIKTTNDKLDKLIKLLSGGDLQVKVVQPDDAKRHD